MFDGFFSTLREAMITHIIWDYNGTVLDDAYTSVLAVNEMLAARGLPKTNLEVYKKTLTMPLTEYYKTVGIYTDDIAVLSQEFRGYCKKHGDSSRIFDGVYDVIAFAKSLGIKNILLSSLYNEHLIEETKKYCIDGWFDTVSGLLDKNLGSKSDTARRIFKEQGINPKNVLFIGDLVTDAITAKEVGADCILIPNGHTDKARCMLACDKVFDHVKEIIEYIKRA